MAIVYRHIRLDKNQPFYIGIGVTKKRAYSKVGRNAHWHNIVSKTPYDVEILFEDLTSEKAQEKEKELISLYGRSDNGGLLCNVTDGGEWRKGMKWSALTRKKMSESRKKSEKVKKIISTIADERRGKKIPWQSKMANNRVGTKRGIEFKKKISQKNLQRDKSIYERIAEKHRGMKRTNEARLNMSTAKQKKKMMGYILSCYSSIVVNPKKVKRHGIA